MNILCTLQFTSAANAYHALKRRKIMLFRSTKVKLKAWNMLIQCIVSNEASPQYELSSALIPLHRLLPSRLVLQKILYQPCLQPSSGQESGSLVRPDMRETSLPHNPGVRGVCKTKNEGDVNHLICLLNVMALH